MISCLIRLTTVHWLPTSLPVVVNKLWNHNLQTEHFIFPTGLWFSIITCGVWMTTENIEEDRNMEEKKIQIKIFPFKLHISILFLYKEWKKRTYIKRWYGSFLYNRKFSKGLQWLNDGVGLIYFSHFFTPLHDSRQPQNVLKTWKIH